VKIFQLRSIGNSTLGQIKSLVKGKNELKKRSTLFRRGPKASCKPARSLLSRGSIDREKRLGKECPLHWRLFFDPLLVSLADQFPGYQTRTTSKHPISSQVQEINTKMVSSSFVDDTSILASSLSEAQATANHTVDFFKYAGVRINAVKTKLIIINEAEETKNLIISQWMGKL
jgi:hypothetical protein